MSRLLPPTASAEDAAKFVATVNDSILELAREQEQAGWVAATYITPDTQAITARANQAYIDAIARNAKDAARFNRVQVSPDVRRQLDLLKTMLVVAHRRTRNRPRIRRELTASMEAAYGSGKWCKDPSQPATCLDIEQITEEMATSRDPARLREVWEGWHTISVPMKKDYVRFTQLANLGGEGTGLCRHRRALARRDDIAKPRHGAGPDRSRRHLRRSRRILPPKCRAGVRSSRRQAAEKGE